jgi:hypothetical protein
VVGGGVRGKENGIARITMIQVGATIKGVHLFIGVYPQVGGMTTGRIVGKGIHGINKEYPTSKCNKIDGVSRVLIKLLLDQKKRLGLLNKNKIGETMKEKEIR